MSVFLSVLAVAIGVMLIGASIGTFVNNNVDFVWSLPLAIFVVFPAFVLGAWFVSPFR